MARTKASVGAKVSIGKNSKARTVCAPSSTSGSSSAGNSKTGWSSGGGNPVCPRETPVWQKSITTFFINKNPEKTREVDEDEARSSKDDKPKPRKNKKNVIESDEEVEVENNTTQELNESTENLPPLDGEDSHKIAEYFPKAKTNDGKKGVGKKSKKSIEDKENESSNSSRRNSAKRDLENDDDIEAGSSTKRHKISL